MSDTFIDEADRELYRILIDNAPESVLILDVDTGKFIDSNEKSLKLFNISKEQLLTKGPLDVSPKMVYGKRASSAAKAYINEAMEGGNPVFDWLHMDRDGREIPCEIRLIRFPPYDRRLVRASIIDMTEKKDMEMALLASEEKFSKSFHLNPNVMILADMETMTILDVNQAYCQKMGYGREELINIPGRLGFAIANRALLDKGMAFIREKTRLTNFEVALLTKEGKEVIILLFVEPIDIQGQYLHLITFVDITERKKAEEKLKNALDQLELAVDTAKLGIWRLNIETNHLDWNDQMLEIYGISRTEYEENLDGWRKQVHPQDEAYANSCLVEIFEGKSAYDIGFRVIRPDGEIRHLTASGSPLYNQEGKLVELIGINMDVTSIKKKDATLQEREAFLRAIFDHSLNAIIVADEAGNYRSANQAAAEMLGYPVEEIVRMNVRQLHTDSGPGAAERYQEYLKTGREIGEFSFIRSDGEVRIAQYHAVRVAENFHLSILTDITERKLAEEKLTKTQQELSEITERFQISTQAAKVGIWDWDTQTDNLIWDDTMFALFGIPATEFTETSAFWRERIHPDDLSQSKLEIGLALKGEKEFNTEFRIVWPDQSIHYIKALGTVQRNEAGKAVRMIGTNWDITKEKEAERQKIRARQLELKNLELEQFAYVASHDLQEPLRTIISFVGLLMRRHENKLEKDAKEYLEFIARGATRMNKLIKGLLEYSSIGSNKKLVEVDCLALIQDILDDLSTQISETNAVFEIGPLPQLKGYETELRLLFQNLISNAIKFRKPDTNPEIRISAQKESGHWKFSVADNGIGIDPQYQEKIFVIFQRLHGRDEVDGTGIGLAHCQKIVDLHGGKIYVESEPDQGSTFYFSISEAIADNAYDNDLSR